ncbi:MAG TPA: pyridoxal-dependent decarboxylase [Gaiellaceae bacterium]|nr:pyridoxal-dependent decarboxylase [Gaiellaceae bacterium]
MTDPLLLRDELDQALAYAVREATRYLGELDESPVLPAGASDAADALAGALPEDGDGALAALTELVEQGLGAATRSSGPRFFHFVTGGVTPAAQGADWLASTLDQNAFSAVSSPLAVRLESVAIEWLLDLFRLPSSWGGVLTTGATTANFTALAAARRWWAERHGVDVDERGFEGLPAPPIFSSGYVHPSATKALAMLGLGRGSVRVLTEDAAGRLNTDSLERELASLDGAPAILIGNAGDVNTGDFDPIEPMADLAERYGAWLHVDGAFGLFARLTPRASGLATGVERANSVISDGHKWLNVPYDCGFAFLRDPAPLHATFGFSAAYLPGDELPGPEASRRARSLAVWTTLRAYGRSGYRAMVERHLDLAQRLAERVDASPVLERLAEVPLNIVCFRFRPPGADESALDDLNARIGRTLLKDGRVYVGTTRYEGRVAFRPAIVNWRTTAADVELIAAVVVELGERELATAVRQ